MEMPWKKERLTRGGFPFPALLIVIVLVIFVAIVYSNPQVICSQVLNCRYQSSACANGRCVPSAAPVVNESAYSAIVPGMNGFALKMFSKLRSEEGNLFFSPFSIETAFAMAAEGARGNTAKEISDAFGLPQDGAETRSSFSALLGKMNYPNDNYALSVANSLWTQAGFPIKADFSSTLENYYSATASTLDFSSDAETSRKTINDWVAGKTDMKILDLIPSGGINSLTRTVLVNAIYFKANWAQQFSKSDTRDGDFYVSPSKTVKVPLMYQPKAQNATYFADESLRALEMDYVGGDLSMLILLPRQNDGLAALEGNLTAQKVSGIRNSMRKTVLPVWLPRFKMAKAKELSGILKDLGIGDAFREGNADFSGISETGRLSITGVFHKAFVEVNEEGTEAAAATGIGMGITSFNPDLPEFRADHPFVFFILDKRSGAILFAGRVSDPSAA